MYQRKLVGLFILFVTSVGDRCLGSSWPFDGYDADDYTDYTDTRSRPTSSCDTENQNALAEIKSEIQNLQQLVVGLRQKLDPDFKVEPSDESKCPPGFEFVKQASSCYKVVYEALDWATADQRCHELHPDAHLVAITTSDENIGLTAYLQKELAKSKNMRIYGRPTKFWTSGQRLNETICTDEFFWKISNNTQLPLSFTDWNRDEPNCWRNELESCLQIRKDASFKWNDVPCDIVEHDFNSLCEYDPL